MNKLFIISLLALGACAPTPQQQAQTQARAQQDADDQQALQTMLNVSSQACLRGIDLGCSFVTSYEYCMQGLDSACADARVYGRMILTAASSTRA